ncbi:copper resistance protein B [Sphingomonas donggukensis]|uniref:Copper resistance protein B n=1 Tax=Sphingomonas donggukensis TaxID=2949093 RepID=A0ABY4TRC5_9SPHN|nr:copper resistance protein B [Sphingomonas donggukensis]URW74853.1 copper resistance protein B [Sphingomonas donggukensis]
MIARLLAAAPLVALATPAVAQDHSGHMMPGMTMPAAKPAPIKRAKPATRKAPAKRPIAPKPTKPASATPPASDPHAGHAMPGMAMPMAGDAMPATEPMPMALTGTALAPGNASPPAPPTDHYADRDFPAGVMDASRHQMMRENGGQVFHQVLFNLAEVQVRDGRDGYRWDGEGWIGGDTDRAVIKSEGSGSFGERIEAAEVQALYSRAIGPYFDLQAGIRHDLAPTPTRTYATVGIEGLAPYMFDVEAAAFLSTKGELLGRLEGWYDQRITQRLVLQPRVELNLSAQDVPETRTGAGLVDAELGLRLRYELAREFAPYVGISYDAKAGRTADYARADGKGATSTSLVAGVRFWF